MMILHCSLQDYSARHLDAHFKRILPLEHVSDITRIVLVKH